jgi:hypothetical protein
LPLPEFKQTNSAVGKIVQCNALYEMLGFSFTTEI